MAGPGVIESLVATRPDTFLGSLAPPTREAWGYVRVNGASGSGTTIEAR